MLPPTLPNKQDDAGNRDRHAGTDATGPQPDVPSPEPVPTRFSAWRSFPRKRRPRRERPLEEGRESLLTKQYLHQNPLRGTAAGYLYSVPERHAGHDL